MLLRSISLREDSPVVAKPTRLLFVAKDLVSGYSIIGVEHSLHMIGQKFNLI
jgi:hypothetical protein